MDLESHAPANTKPFSGPLRRSGAIRESTNPLTRRKTSGSVTPSQATDHTCMQYQDMDDRDTEGAGPTPDRDKQRDTRDSDSTCHSDQSWVLCHCHTSHVSPVNFLSALSPSSSLYANFNSQTMQDWRDDLTWNLNDVQILRDLLKTWVYLGVTASHIGEFLVNVLYRRDDHLDGRVTHMVDTHQPYMIIGLHLLKHYQTRDDHGIPLWRLNKLKLGDPYARPGNPIPPILESDHGLGPNKSLPDTPQDNTTDTRNTWYFIPAPKPFRPFEQAVFLNDTEGWRFIEAPSPKESSRKPCRSSGAVHQVPKLSLMERRAMMRSTGDLPHASSAEVIGDVLQDDLIPPALYTDQDSQRRRKHFGVAQFRPSPLSHESKF